MKNSISLDEIIGQIRDREIDIAHMRGDVVAGKKALDAAKLPAYAEVLAFLGSNTGGTLEGLRTFWTKRTAGAFREGLVAAGVTPASAKRYSENAVNAFRVNDDLRKASAEGRAFVMAWFEQMKITSERAIKAMVSKPVDPLDALANRVALLTHDQYEQLVVKVAALVGVAKREAEAKRAKEGKAEVIFEQVAIETGLQNDAAEANPRYQAKRRVEAEALERQIAREIADGIRHLDGSLIEDEEEDWEEEEMSEETRAGILEKFKD